MAPPWAAIWLPVVLVYGCLGYGTVAPGGWLSDASNAGTARGLRIVTRSLPAPEGCWPGAFGHARRVRALLPPRVCAHAWPRRPLTAQDPSTLSPSVAEVDRVPQAALVGPSRNIDKSQPLYLQGDELIYDNGRQPRRRARQRRDLLQQLHPDRGPGRLRPVRQHADGCRQRRAEGAQRQHRPRRPLHADRRLPRRLRCNRSASWRRTTRASPPSAPSAAAATSPCSPTGASRRAKAHDGMPPLWCLSAATVTHDQQAATITYQDAQFELFGVPVLYMPYFEHADPSVKRKSGFLMPEFSGSDALGLRNERSLLLRAGAELRLLVQPACTRRARASCGRASGVSGLANGQYYIKVAGIDQDAGQLPSSIVDPEQYAGWRGSIESKGLFSLSSLVEVRVGRHARDRRHVPPLLQARQHPCDRPRRQGVPRGHLRPQLFRRRALSLRRADVRRHAQRDGQLRVVCLPDPRLQLHLRRPAGLAASSPGTRTRWPSPTISSRPSTPTSARSR